MLSEEALIRMMSGDDKSIKLIKVNDLVMNKFNKVSKVTSIHTKVAHDAITVQIDNGSDVFYCSPSTLFYNHDTLVNNSHSSGFNTLAEITAKNNSKLKSSSKTFSPESDIDILSYDATIIPKTLYCFDTNESTCTFYVNNVISKC